MQKDGRMNRFENNLSEGSVLKGLIRFSTPFLLSNIVQSLYNVADMLVVGKFSGTASIAGVNIGGQVTFILTNLIMGLCTGGTVLIAQYIGSGSREKLKKTVSTLFTGLIAAAVVITVVMLLLKNQVLQLLSTPPDTFSEASDYLWVTVTGVVFIFGYNALSAILRGMGDSKRPLIFVSIACATNVVLDIILVWPFHMGALGAAIATVISQGLSMFLCIRYLRQKDFLFDFKFSSFRIDRGQLKTILKIGMPAAIQNTVVSMSFLFITKLVSMVGGTTALAAAGVVGKFNSFAILPAIGMSAAVSTMAAQNIGAGKWDRALKSTRIGMVIAIGFSLTAFLVAQLFPEAIIALFDKNPKTIADGVAYMRSFTFDYLIVPFVFCLNGLYIGAGHTTFSLITGLVSSLLARIPASYLFGKALGWGLSGLGLGAPVASLVSLMMVLGFFLSGRWKVNVADRHIAGDMM
jgi:putative MATE family efflux protein